jgi:CrcB protein
MRKRQPRLRAVDAETLGKFAESKGSFDLVTKILLVMIGGSLGAVSRYAIALLAAKYAYGSFPWGTLLANLGGCFMIGIAFGLAERTEVLSPAARLLFMTGFLGAMTTFSTFALETLTSFRAGNHQIAVINFLINNIGGVALVLSGILLVQVIYK